MEDGGSPVFYVWGVLGPQDGEDLGGDGVEKEQDGEDLHPCCHEAEGRLRGHGEEGAGLLAYGRGSEVR